MSLKLFFIFQASLTFTEILPVLNNRIVTSFDSGLLSTTNPLRIKAHCLSLREFDLRSNVAHTYSLSYSWYKNSDFHNCKNFHERG